MAGMPDSPVPAPEEEPALRRSQRIRNRLSGVAPAAHARRGKAGGAVGDSRACGWPTTPRAPCASLWGDAGEATLKEPVRSFSPPRLRPRKHQKQATDTQLPRLTRSSLERHEDREPERLEVKLDGPPDDASESSAKSAETLAAAPSWKAAVEEAEAGSSAWFARQRAARAPLQRDLKGTCQCSRRHAVKMRCHDLFSRRGERLLECLARREASLQKRKNAELDYLRDSLASETAALEVVMGEIEKAAHVSDAVRDEHRRLTRSYELTLAKRHAQIQALHRAPQTPAQAPAQAPAPKSLSRTKASLTARATPPAKVGHSRTAQAAGPSPAKGAKPRWEAKCKGRLVKAASTQRRFAAAKQQARRNRARSRRPRGRPPAPAKKAPAETPVVPPAPCTAKEPPVDEKHAQHTLEGIGDVANESGSGPEVKPPVRKGQKMSIGPWHAWHVMSEPVTRSRARPML
mmetsp:Transcript_73210/g.207015  ORF Transcript_73210/g.207015 Transcript_73210/m.207015 type:complete len:461 (-) Transcript_73210:164-1546(-)